MMTIPEVVEEIIRKTPFIEEALADGLVNVSALARYIRPELEERMQKPVNEGAIIMAINRLEPGTYQRMQTKINNFFSSVGDIIVRSNLSEYTYANSSSVFEKQAEILKMVSRQKESFCTFSQGVYESTIIISDDICEELERLMKSEKCIGSITHLSSVTLKMPKENIQIAGIYYYILKRLAWENINIVEIISTSHEFTLIVKDVDVDVAFSIMMKLKKPV